MLEGSNDLSLPVCLQGKCQTSYNYTLYGTWLSSLPALDVGTKFSFCGNRFMISKSNIDSVNLMLFILSHVLVLRKKSVALIPFCVPSYYQSDYWNIVKYKHSNSMYSMCMNGYVSGKFNRKNLSYIDAHPCTHGNIAGS